MMNNVDASFRFDLCCSEETRISSSCNGLLCIIINGVDYKRTCTFILNPMTNEYTQLPASEDFCPFYLYGFGFSLKTMQYKVARASHDHERHGSVIEIFTLGESSKWSNVAFLSPLSSFVNDGVYFKGAIYWIGEQEQERKAILCCLDLEDEDCRLISLPEETSHFHFLAIGVFNGSLYTTVLVEGTKFEVWMMQNHGGGEDSWIREFVVDIPEEWNSSVPWREHLRLIRACENGEILCLIENLYLFLYNPKTGNINTLIQVKRHETIFSIHQIESLNFDSLDKIFGVGHF